MNENNFTKKIVVFAGPSGSGKDTLMQEIMKLSKNIVKLTTATTRDMREGEINGEMYYFLTKEKFLEDIENNLIPEYNEHAGNLYGTYLPDLDNKIKQGKIIFSQIQLVGAKYLKEHYGALTLFFVADSFDILEKRIRSRSELSSEEIDKRIEIAKYEVEEESKFYDYVIENKEGELDITIKKVLEIFKKEGVSI